MHTVKLRAVGGSVMLAIPKSMLEGLSLHANQKVGVSILDGRIIVEPKVKPRYTLAELLAISDYSQAQAPEDLAWVAAPAAGRELL